MAVRWTREDKNEEVGKVRGVYVVSDRSGSGKTTASLVALNALMEQVGMSTTVQTGWPLVSDQVLSG